MNKEDLILKVFKKCYEISNNSKTDVFFDYAPHCNFYGVRYYLEGANNTDDCNNINISDSITIKNLQKTLKELDKLWELIVENNLNNI